MVILVRADKRLSAINNEKTSRTALHSSILESVIVYRNEGLCIKIYREQSPETIHPLSES